jgi:hypothetical protein
VVGSGGTIAGTVEAGVLLPVHRQCGRADLDARTGGPGAHADLAWNSGAEATASREPNRWVLEMRIPLRELGIGSPVAGKTILANFFRNRYCGGPAVYSCWSPTLTIQHANIGRFGKIVFGGD